MNGDDHLSSDEIADSMVNVGFVTGQSALREFSSQNEVSSHGPLLIRRLGG